MTSRAATVAFQGIEAVSVDVQAQFLSGLVQFNVVGLGDKAVAESRERVRAALHAIGLALPGKRLVVNLSPADLPKEGSHFDLPITLAVLAALGIIPQDFLNRYVVMGELALDGAILGVSGVLPAAIAANGRDLGLICPRVSGPEAAWAGEDADILAPENLIQLINHVKGTQVLTRPKPAVAARGGGDAGPSGRQGAGDRQAGPRSGGGGRPPSSDGGASGSRKVHAGAAAALDPAADGFPRDAGRQHGGLARRRDFGRQAVAAAALPRAAPFGKHAGPGRRRPARQARRNGARPPWRAVPRRAAGIPAARAGVAPPADGNGRDGRGAGQLSRHLSCPLPAGRRHEPLQMRHGGRARASSAARARAVRRTIRRDSPARCWTGWTSRSSFAPSRPRT